MNFLAHLLLSCEEEELLVGNFLGDFVKNRDLPMYSAGIVRGVHLHRTIDSFTDTHPEVRKGTARLRVKHGKYAPVVIDVFYDYILSKEWQHYGPKPLRQFTRDMYEVLDRHRKIMPASLSERVQLMIQDDWLMNYGTLEGMAHTFRRLQRRVSQPVFLTGIIDTLQQEQEELTAEFHRFFPDLIQEVQAYCSC